MSANPILEEIELMTDVSHGSMTELPSGGKLWRWDNLTEKQVQHLAGSLRSEFGRNAVKVQNDGSEPTATPSGVVELTLKG